MKKNLIFALAILTFFIVGCSRQTTSESIPVQAGNNSANTNQDVIASPEVEAVPMSPVPTSIDPSTKAEIESIDKIFDSVDADDFGSSNLDEIEL